MSLSNKEIHALLVRLRPFLAAPEAIRVWDEILGEMETATMEAARTTAMQAVFQSDLRMIAARQYGAAEAYKTLREILQALKN